MLPKQFPITFRGPQQTEDLSIKLIAQNLLLARICILFLKPPKAFHFFTRCSVFKGQLGL
jgi:hypothetical protein